MSGANLTPQHVSFGERASIAEVETILVGRVIVDTDGLSDTNGRISCRGWTRSHYIGTQGPPVRNTSIPGLGRGVMQLILLMAIHLMETKDENN